MSKFATSRSRNYLIAHHPEPGKLVFGIKRMREDIDFDTREIKTAVELSLDFNRELFEIALHDLPAFKVWEQYTPEEQKAWPSGKYILTREEKDTAVRYYHECAAYYPERYGLQKAEVVPQQRGEAAPAVVNG